MEFQTTFGLSCALACFPVTLPEYELINRLEFFAKRLPILALQDRTLDVSLKNFQVIILPNCSTLKNYTLLTLEQQIKVFVS